MLKKWFVLFFVSTYLSGYSQVPTTEKYIYPLNLPPLLSATFGELRPNHFHAGLDFKTQGKTGWKVKAVKSGYISRIKVQKGGYGKAIYIQHPDGNISVYAHLEKFAGDLEQFVKSKQYQHKSFFIDLEIPESLFPVRQGQVIGYSGNTGSSMGPHLHFEIRKGMNVPLNPMLFGLTVEDHQKPVLKNVYLYALNDTSHVNMQNNKIKLNIYKNKTGIFISEPVTAYGEIGVGITAYDLQDKTWHKNGVYKVELIVNGMKIYESRMDKVSYSTTRYINTMIDYPFYYHYRQYIQKLWKHPRANLPVFAALINKGKIKVENGKTYQITVHLYDFQRNKTSFKTTIQGKKINGFTGKKTDRTPFLLSPGQSLRIHSSLTDVFFPKGSVYDPVYIAFSETSNGFFIRPEDIPFHKPFVVKYSLKNQPDALKKFLYLASIHPRTGKKRFASAIKSHDSLILQTRTPGRYELAIDSIPPVITGLNIQDNKWISNYRYLKFKVFDKHSGVKKVEGYLDGRWILLEWDYKTGKVFYNFNDLKPEGTKHTIQLIVTDKVGNRTEKTIHFYRKFAHEHG